MAARKPKGAPITKTPTVRKYKGVGDVKVWKDSRGKIHRRKVGVRNTTDKSAAKRNSKRRIKGFANTTDGSRRAQHRK
ncbi:MAG: hypothetical protein V1715_04435 [bacterium]